MRVTFVALALLVRACVLPLPAVALLACTPSALQQHATVAAAAAEPLDEVGALLDPLTGQEAEQAIVDKALSEHMGAAWARRELAKVRAVRDAYRGLRAVYAAYLAALVDAERRNAPDAAMLAANDLAQAWAAFVSAARAAGIAVPRPPHELIELFTVFDDT